jgi:hypothetical protein
LGSLGIKSQWGANFLHFSRLALGPTHLPVQWVLDHSQGLGGRGMALTSHPNLVLRLKKEYSYTSTPPLAFVTCSRVKFTLFITDYYFATFMDNFCWLVPSTWQFTSVSGVI